MNDVVEAKREFRRELRARRRAMSDAARVAGSLSIAEAVVERVGDAPEAVDGAVFCYVSIGAEVQTRPLLNRWLNGGVAVWVPRMDPAAGRAGEHDMVAVRLYELGPMTVGLHDVPTVAEGEAMSDVPAWVVLPCVGVTRDGRRLGQGGGHYDRYLGRLRERGASVKTVALAFDCQVVDDVPGEGHDERVDAVCTESGWVEC